jgi:hypothetical protein
VVGVAVKVTDAPEHIDVDDAFTDTMVSLQHLLLIV